MSDLTTGTALDERQHLYALCYARDGLRWCGCGSPEDAYDLVREILALAPFYEGYESGHPNHEKVRALLGGGDGVFYLVLYGLDAAGLIEHGGSVGGAWLSPKGKHYLPLMQRYGWVDLEDDDNGAIIPVGLPHDGKDCAEVKCPHWLSSQG